jgi:hypothetical protein
LIRSGTNSVSSRKIRCFAADPSPIVARRITNP